MAELWQNMVEHGRTWQNTVDNIPTAVIAIAYYK